MIGLSLNAYAQTSGIIPLDGLHHSGVVSIQNIQVSEKEFYKVIHLNVQFKVKDLGLEDSAFFEPNSIKLVNENGKSYYPEYEECTATDPAGTVSFPPPCRHVETDCGVPMFEFGIKGTEGGIGNYHPCFRVEKEFNNFNVYYGYYVQFPKTIMGYTQIGNIDLTQSASGQATPSNPSDSNPSTSNPPSSSTDQSATNVFEQLLNFLKQIFHFMVLGSTLLNDSQR